MLTQHTVSRDVVFFEKHFAFHFSNSNSSHTPFFLPLVIDPSPFSFDSIPDIFQYSDTYQTHDSSNSTLAHDHYQIHDSSYQSSQEIQPLRRSVRESKTPAHLSD